MTAEVCQRHADWPPFAPKIGRYRHGWPVRWTTSEGWKAECRVSGSRTKKPPVTGCLSGTRRIPGGFHKLLGKALFVAIISAHVLAALYHQFVRKDGKLRRILVPGE